jgi:hypothetical protein
MVIKEQNIEFNQNHDIEKSLEKWTLSKSGVRFNKKTPKPARRNTFNKRSLADS